MRVIPTPSSGEQGRPHHLMVSSSGPVIVPPNAVISTCIMAASYFSILPISPTESEAAYVLDGLFDHDTILEIEEHFTDTGGASDHVFALFTLIGKRFAPRLRNLKDRKFHTFEKADSYPALANHIGAPFMDRLNRLFL